MPQVSPIPVCNLDFGAGPVFNRKDVVKQNGADGPTTDVTLLSSTDKKFTAGLYKAGETVVLPRGWKGRWTTSDYTKYYVVYDSK